MMSLACKWNGCWCCLLMQRLQLTMMQQHGQQQQQQLEQLSWCRSWRMPLFTLLMFPPSNCCFAISLFVAETEEMHSVGANRDADFYADDTAACSSGCIYYFNGSSGSSSSSCSNNCCWSRRNIKLPFAWPPVPPRLDSVSSQKLGCCCCRQRSEMLPSRSTSSSLFHSACNAIPEAGRYYNTVSGIDWSMPPGHQLIRTFKLSAI